MRLSYASPGTLRGISAALSLWLTAFHAEAHAPEARGVALTPDASVTALALPGFGLLWRAAPTQPFAYVCSALLGALPSAALPSIAFYDDGSLLWGTQDGLRVLGKDGCPLGVESELHKAQVVALAIAKGAPQLAYAVVSGDKQGLWRSLDGGKHWELRSALPSAAEVTALVVSSSDPEHVWLSESGTQGNLLRVSTNGGAQLSAHTQPLALTLLHVRGGAKPQLWAQARDALTVGNRGRAILRAAAPEGPWQMPLRVAYFGGLAIDAQGTISVGDEIGGLYQSDDDGESFRKLPGDVPVACLAQAGSARWACTPGTLTDPVLQRIDANAAFAKTTSLAEVDRMITCSPALEVERVCASAWVEWQRDVLRLPSFTPDAGSTPGSDDAGITDAAASDATLADAAPPDTGAAPPDSQVEPSADADAGMVSPTSPVPKRARSADCSLGPGEHPAGRRSPLFAAFATLCIAWRIRRRDARARGTRLVVESAAETTAAAHVGP